MITLYFPATRKTINILSYKIIDTIYCRLIKIITDDGREQFDEYDAWLILNDDGNKIRIHYYEWHKQNIIGEIII